MNSSKSEPVPRVLALQGALEAERRGRAALFPANARCERCGEPDPLVLVASDVRLILCADCDAIARGLPPFERHHIAGKAYGPDIVTVRCNMHRRLTVRRRLRDALMHRLGPTVSA